MNRNWSNHPIVQWFRGTLIWRIVLATIEIRLYDRALTIAGQAFIALVPLLIVVATLLSSSDALAIGQWLIDRFSLTGASADAVRSLFGRPPSASGGLSVLSVITVLVSAASFARSIQRTYEVAWKLPARGLRRTIDGLQGAVLLLLALILLASLASLADDLPGGLLVSLIAETCAAIPAWWLSSRLLLTRRVAWMSLLPGAVVSALAQVIVSAFGARWVPYLIERNTERYGVVGVAIALISWLVILSLLIVASAVVGAQLGAALAEHNAGKQPAATSEQPTDPCEQSTDAGKQSSDAGEDTT